MSASIGEISLLHSLSTLNLNLYASIVKEIQISLCIYVGSQSSLTMRLCIHVAKLGHHSVPGQAALEAVYKYTVHFFPINWQLLCLNLIVEEEKDWLQKYLPVLIFTKAVHDKRIDCVVKILAPQSSSLPTQLSWPVFDVLYWHRILCLVDIIT